MKADVDGPGPCPVTPAEDPQTRQVDRPQLESRLAQVEKSREWLLEVFAAHIHRISQPLTALQGVVELALLKDCNAAECREVLEDSLEQLERLRQGVAALRDLAETERDANPAGQPFPLIEIVGRTAEVAGVLAESSGATVEIETQGDFHVFARAGRLELALHEVIRMALRRLGRDASLRVSFRSLPGFACVSLADASRPLPAAIPQASLAPARGPDAGRDEAGGWDWTVARRMVELAGGRFEGRTGAASTWVVSVFLPTSASEENC
jgi:signal transduction histidine kinase